MTPTGTFLGPTEPAPLIKLRLNPDGTYLSEDLGPPQYWMMMEGRKVYPERMKARSQKGRWTWNRSTGEVVLTPEPADFAPWMLGGFRFDKENPQRLAWGSFRYLERSETAASP